MIRIFRQFTDSNRFEATRIPSLPVLRVNTFTARGLLRAKDSDIAFAARFIALVSPKLNFQASNANGR